MIKLAEWHVAQEEGFLATNQMGVFQQPAKIKEGGDD
jgi:hypothetical protein